MLSDTVKNRLLNWKFESAWAALQREWSTPEVYAEVTMAERETVFALSTTFGNCGWFDGSMSDIVRAAVWFLGVTDEE